MLRAVCNSSVGDNLGIKVHQSVGCFNSATTFSEASHFKYVHCCSFSRGCFAMCGNICFSRRSVIFAL